MGLNVDTVLFDLDGTLIDSNAAHAEAWARALRDDAIDVTAATIRPLVGMGGDKLLQKVAGLSERSERGRRIGSRKKHEFAAFLSSLKPTRGALDLLEYLRTRRLRLGIATSAEDAETDALLKQAGLDSYFPDWTRTSREDAPRSKPDPDIIRAALHRSHARASGALMVGDTPYDVRAAARAGVATIALRCGGYWRDTDFCGALRICDDPAALKAGWQSTQK